MGPLPLPGFSPVADPIAAAEECTAEGKLFIDEQLSSISDPVLKEAIQKAMRRRLAVKKEAGI
jgi:hypothetical protein